MIGPDVLDQNDESCIAIQALILELIVGHEHSLGKPRSVLGADRAQSFSAGGNNLLLVVFQIRWCRVMPAQGLAQNWLQQLGSDSRIKLLGK